MKADSCFWPIPVGEIDGDVTCGGCDDPVTGEAYYDGEGTYYCESCATDLAEGWTAEATEYAVQNCRITAPVPAYDPQREFRCTPEEYEAGAKESYTPNAHLAHCRHRCTNYEELLRGLDRDRAHDRVRVAAIRERVTELLEEAIVAADLDAADLDAEDGEGTWPGG